MENQTARADTSRAGAPAENQELSLKNQGTAGSGGLRPQRKRWGKKHTVILVIVLVVVWFVGVQLMAAERYSAVVNVVEGIDKVGVNPTADRLDFGDLSHDTGASRFVTLANNGKVAKQIWVVKTGGIAELMNIDRGGWFVLKAGEQAKIEFNVKIPSSAPYQQFRGKVIIFKWPKLF